MKKPSEKGFAYERKVAKELSLWFSDGENPNIFWRTAGSGGRASRQKAFLGASYGDIGLLDPVGEPLLRIVTWELKKGYTKDLDIIDLLDGKTANMFEKFWLKACKDADQAFVAGWGSAPFLVIRRNNKMPLLVMHYAFHLKLIDYCGPMKEGPLASLRKGNILIRIMRLNDFLDWCSPGVFYDLYKAKRFAEVK